MSSLQAPLFEALIVPHRSLTRGGMLVLVAVFSSLTTAVAIRFVLLRAWPVVAFSLFEIPLVILLLAINLRRSRASELIMLGARELTVTRTDPSGRRQQIILPAAWLRIDLHPGHGASSMVLSSHGRRCEVGSFLHEPDRISLFEALSDALYRIRNPRFENPHLLVE